MIKVSAINAYLTVMHAVTLLPVTLVPRTCVAGPTCPTGYYLNSTISTCRMCKPECSACSTFSSCSSCNIGFTLSGVNCIRNCGNGIRTQGEQCDDGNAINGDGCSSNCTLEKGFICSMSSPDFC
jgi:cysteine-rich repeat protein